MSDQRPTPDDLPGGDAALCAEYVLGLLSGDEQRAFEQRLSRDGDLQAEVAYWCENLADLTLGLPEVTPAPAVLRRIEIAAFGPGRPPLWRLVLPYILGAVAAAAVAWVASVSGVLETQQAGTPLQAALSTPEAGQGDAPAALAEFDPETATLRVTTPPIDLPEGRGLHLWLQPGNAAVLPLGTLTGDITDVTIPPDLIARLPGATLFVTDEPDGAVQIAPTGPALTSGVLIAP